MYGLVLEGGGAKGSYHLGVYKAIREMGFEIGGVVGTSIGAINGAMIVQDEYEELHRLWSNLSYSMVIDIEEEEIKKIKEMSILKADVGFLVEKFKRFVADRGLDITPTKEILEKYIDEDKIRNSGKDFGIVTVNLSEMKAVEIFLEDMPRGELKDYLLASAYVPFFKTERLGGNIYLDGAFYDNLPFNMLIDKGYENLIIIRTHSPGIVRRIDLKSIDANVIMVSPSDNIGRMYLFEEKQAKVNIKMGYYDGLRAFKGLKGSRYYIDCESCDDFAFDYFVSLREEEVLEIKKILKISKMPGINFRRLLFEYIVPRLFNLLSFDENSSYEDLLIRLAEIKAENLNLERYEVYKFYEFIDKLKEKEILLRGQREDATVFDKIAGRVDDIYYLNKNENLLKIADILFSRNDKS